VAPGSKLLYLITDPILTDILVEFAAEIIITTLPALRVDPYDQEIDPSLLSLNAPPDPIACPFHSLSLKYIVVLAGILTKATKARPLVPSEFKPTNIMSPEFSEITSLIGNAQKTKM
jgi:hypothetical protein